MDEDAIWSDIFDALLLPPIPPGAQLHPSVGPFIEPIFLGDPWTCWKTETRWKTDAMSRN